MLSRLLFIVDWFGVKRHTFTNVHACAAGVVIGTQPTHFLFILLFSITHSIATTNLIPVINVFAVAEMNFRYQT
jgi:hypothetical protein